MFYVSFICSNVSVMTLLMLVHSAADLSVGAEEQILTCNQPDMDDCLGSENQDEEAVAMIEESPSGTSLVKILFLEFYISCV